MAARALSQQGMREISTLRASLRGFKARWAYPTHFSYTYLLCCNFPWPTIRYLWNVLLRYLLDGLMDDPEA